MVKYWKAIICSKKNKKNTPVSGGRKEGLQIPAEEDILFDEAGLADAKRPFLTAHFGVEDWPAMVASTAAILHL